MVKIATSGDNWFWIAFQPLVKFVLWLPYFSLLPLIVVASMDVHDPKSWKRTNFYDALGNKNKKKTSEFTLAGRFNQLPRTTIYWLCFVSGNVGKHCIWVTSNSLHPNISLQLFLTVLYTFPMVLIMRICLAKNFSSLGSFPVLLWPKCVIQGWYCWEKPLAYHS